MSGLFGAPAPQVISMPAVRQQSITATRAPTPNSASVQNAGTAAAAALGSGAGQQSTILTSGLGAPGAPPIAKKMLLGQ